MMCIGIGSCVWRESLASAEPNLTPAQEARLSQIEEALRDAFPVEQHCAKRIEYGDTVICISAQQLKRMEKQQ